MAFFQKNKSYKQVLGVEIAEQRVSASLRDASGVIAIYQSAADEPEYQAFKHWIKNHNADGLPVFVSLHPESYQEQLVEAPPVPDEELESAISFAAREFIDQPDHYEIQAIKLPDDAFHGRKKMVIAVTVAKAFIAKISQFFQKLKSPIQHISIAELSLLQLLTNNNQPASLAILRLDQEMSDLYLYHQGAIYLTREIEMGLQHLVEESTIAASELALKLQRSMDYFESQLGLPSLMRIYILQNESLKLDEHIAVLEESIGITIRPLTINYLCSEEILQQQTLTAGVVVATGGALAYELDH